MRPKRIAFVALSANVRVGGYGTGDIAWEFAREFADLGVESHLLSPSELPQESISGVTLHHLPASSRWTTGRSQQLWRAFQAARGLYAIGRVDAIYTHEIYTAAALGVLHPAPLVYGTPQIYPAPPPVRLASPRLRSLEEALVRRRARLIHTTSSVMTSAMARRGVPDSRLSEIPCGVDLETFAHQSDARRRLGLSDDDRVVLYAGRMMPEKNVDRLIKAIRSIGEQGKPATLHLAGTGLLFEKHQQLAQDLGASAVFHGDVEWQQLPSWYSAADVCVLPSIWEPFGRVMAEAMACGTPFVGARGTGMADHVEPGVNGLLCDPASVESIAGALRTMLDQPEEARRMGAAGRAYAQRVFAWPLVARQLHDAVLTMLADRGGRHEESA